MKVLDAEFVKGFMRMADDGWQQGWHERNGGNLSYRIKLEEVESVRGGADPRRVEAHRHVRPQAGGGIFPGDWFRKIFPQRDHQAGRFLLHYRTG